ncbi:hypothetical protein ACNOYE_14530 [Nannocystaceae bacterium ST9]
MRRSTILALATLLAAACHAKPGSAVVDPEPQPEPVVEPDEGEPVVAREVELSPLGEHELAVGLGATLRYSFKSHASVGFGASQRSDDEAVIRYVRTDMQYSQSEADRAGKPGSDAATGIFVFEAVGPGTTTLVVDEEFRGAVERSTTFTITVTP